MKNKLLILVLVICIASLNFVSASLTDGLVAYYELEEDAANTDVSDSHGSNDGTASTNTNNLNTVGKINDAFDFDASNSEYVEGTGGFITSYPFTLSGWVYVASDYSDYGVITGLHKSTTHGNQYYIRVRGDQGGFAEIVAYDSNFDGVQGTTDIRGGWHLVTGVYSSATDRELYVDGGSEATSTISRSYNTGDNFAIGANRDTSPGSYIDGKLDEVGIWNRTLTDSEISDLYNNGDGFIYPFVEDTCSCPGAGNDWEINMSDYCNITSDCDLTTGKLSFTGSGITRINATINTTDLGDPGTNGILKILLNCWIWDY